MLGSPVSHRGGGASVRSPTVHAVSGSFTRRSPATRQLLERESDVIDRHFMHAHLEALLYQSRDAFASALDEYDAACRQHDSEMDGIRAAFLAKWGQVPVLETYKQMAIRQQKAKNFEQALSWAERQSPSMATIALAPRPSRTYGSGQTASRQGSNQDLGRPVQGSPSHTSPRLRRWSVSPASRSSSGPEYEAGSHSTARRAEAWWSELPENRRSGSTILAMGGVEALCGQCLLRDPHTCLEEALDRRAKV